MKPTFIDAAMPERYTAEALETIFRDRLTETERQLIANPFLCTEPMKQWAHELTRGATTDLDKAKAIFDGLATRRGASGRLRSRTAREVFDAWKDTDATLVCMDHAVLLTALLRAVDVNAFFVNVTKDPGGKVINHACAAVFTGDRTILVDSMQRWFGAPHQEYAILNDLETTAFLCFNNQFGDPMELAGYRAGLKLWPDSILGRLVLISALYRTRQSEEGHRILDAIAAAPSNDYTAAFYWRTRGLVEEDKRNWERAMEYQRKATSIDPHNATAHYHLGRLHLDRGHPAEAREAFRTCLRNNPDPMIADIVRRQLIQINEQIGSAGAVAPASSKSDAP